MKRVHKLSCDCHKTELMLFDLPFTQTVIEKSRFVEYHPIASLSDGGPIQFFVPGGGENYVDPATNELHVKAQITKADGSPIDDGTEVGPINLFLHSLFSNVSISWNDKLISSASGNYPYRAYLESLLTYGPSAKKSQLSASLYYHDTATKMDISKPSQADGNEGLKARSAFTAGGKVVDLVGRLHSSVLLQDRLLLNGVDMKVKLTRANPEFCLMSSEVNPNFKVKIVDAVWKLRKVQVNPTVMLEHARALEKTNARYPVKRGEIKIISVPRGYHSVDHENVFLNQVPRRLILGFVDAKAYHGSYTTNPFNFKHHDVNFLEVTVNGESVPMKPLQPKYDEAGGAQYIAAYQTLFGGSGKLFRDEGLDITREDYAGGYTLYCFDLTPDLSSSEQHFNLIQQGSVNVKAQFGKALTETVNLVVYAEFSNVIEIDRQRNVIFDYTL